MSTRPARRLGGAQLEVLRTWFPLRASLQQIVEEPDLEASQVYGTVSCVPQELDAAPLVRDDVAQPLAARIALAKRVLVLFAR